jgi:hypothetical protein
MVSISWFSRYLKVSPRSRNPRLRTGFRWHASLSFRGPAACPRNEQHGLGVEDWDFPATAKPAARRLSFRLDQMCFAAATVVSGAAAARPGKTFSKVIGRFA